jgi:hypothetical protein
VQPSVVDRLNKLLTDATGTLLTGDALRNLTVFDYNNITPAAGAKGGSILLATVTNFPILEALGLSGAFSSIEPCGLNIPHLHPRANEMLTVLEGVLDTGFVQEDGFDTEIETRLGKYQATLFPMGSMHWGIVHKYFPPPQLTPSQTSRILPATQPSSPPPSVTRIPAGAISRPASGCCHRM